MHQSAVLKYYLPIVIPLIFQIFMLISSPKSSNYPNNEH